MVAPKCWLPLYEFRTDLNNSKSLKISLIIATSLPLVVSSESRLVAFCSLRPYGLYSLRNSPGQNTGVGSFSLFQGIFPTYGLNPGLPPCSWILYHLSHRGSPKAIGSRKTMKHPQGKTKAESTKLRCKQEPSNVEAVRSKGKPLFEGDNIGRS